MLRNVGWDRRVGVWEKRGRRQEKRGHEAEFKRWQEQGETEKNFATCVIFCNRNGTKRREPLRKWAGCGS